MRLIVALLCGMLFGAGLTISQMVNPNKVLNFLDVFGNWDPSLAFVMIGGISVFWLGFFLIVKKRSKPVLAEKFDLPTNSKMDKKLLFGGMLFGLGWGLAGICPGPAIANISGGDGKILGFIVMMLLGMQSVTWLTQARESN
jgi:uncharacterized membrane protein YedE/YeeE